MRHRGLFFPEWPDLSIPKSSGRISSLIFRNIGTQPAAIDEILNGGIVGRGEFLWAQPLDGDKGFLPGSGFL